MLTLLSARLTHPETAGWILAVPPALAIAALLALSLALRARLLAAVQQLLLRRARRGRLGSVDPALDYIPPLVTAPQLLASCVVCALAVLIMFSSISRLFIALVLAGPATALLIRVALWGLERRYIDRLDRSLPAAVSRLAALIAAGTGPQPALRQVVHDLPAGPLRCEWGFLCERLGAPLQSGARATATDVVAALAVQTSSARHRSLLGHLEIALTQPQNVLIRRMQAAGSALYAAEQRRSAALTELAQMRYSGLAVGLAGLGMAAYLFLTQRERFAQAYSGAAGGAVAVVVSAALLAPIVVGLLLSQADELDY